MKKKSIIVSTNWFLGIIIFILLVLIPTVKVFIAINNPYNVFLDELPDLYKKLDIPAIELKDGVLNSNDGKLFFKSIKSQDAKEETAFKLFIDTSDIPDSTLPGKIRTRSGGFIIYKDHLVYFDPNKQKEQLIPLDKLPKNLKITLDDKLIKDLSNKYKHLVLYLIIASFFIFYFVAKLFWWGVISLIYADRAKSCGGGNCSLAVWSLVIPTVFQSLVPAKGPCCCFSCATYYILLFASVYFMRGKLVISSLIDE